MLQKTIFFLIFKIHFIKLERNEMKKKGIKNAGQPLAAHSPNVFFRLISLLFFTYMNSTRYLFFIFGDSSWNELKGK